MKTFRTVLAVLMFFGLFAVSAIGPIALGIIDTVQNREALINSIKKSEILTKSEFIEHVANEDEMWDKQGLVANYETWGIGRAVESTALKLINVMYDWLNSDKKLFAEVDLTNEIEEIIVASIDAQFEDLANSDLSICTPEEEDELNTKISDAYYYDTYPINVDEIYCKPSSLAEIKDMYKTYGKALFIANASTSPLDTSNLDSFNPVLEITYESLEVSENDAEAFRSFYKGMGTIKWMIITSFVLLASFGVALMPDRKIGFYVAAGTVAFILISYLPTLFIGREAFMTPPDPDPAVNYFKPFVEEYFYLVSMNMKIYIIAELVAVIALIGGGVALGQASATNTELLPQTPMDPDSEKKAYVKA